MLKATLSLRDSITHEVLSTEDVIAVRDDAPPVARTISGYGNKLPTPYRVHLANRWHRVYARCWSNVATHYINSDRLAKTGVNVVVTDIFEEVHPK